MLKSFVILLLSTSSAFAAPAVFNTESLKSRFASPVLHDGPNCYNAALLALGYIDQQTYSSGKELDFYLKHFCEEVQTTPEKAPNGALMTYRNSDESLAHTASLLGNGWVFEKNNYRGTNYAELRPYSYPGHYLFVPYKNSIYAPYQSIYKTAIYQCQSADEVQAALQPVKARPFSARLDEMRATLGDAIATKNIEELSLFLSETGFLQLVELQGLLRGRTKTAIEKEYLYMTGQSIFGQIKYAYESAQLFCIPCRSHDIGPLNNELIKTEDILKKYRPKKPAAPQQEPVAP